eukprot:TRINITY_DN34237_c0_g1_i1.p1 TRINITY_DN34237_c0_g1~~TRINITY_DN34237_c0_g1_i1.p1  ORF type:complete len:189 (+),score=43.19 TRINITY_DN34237_c0_g1_i1:62-628(+)
MWVGMIVKFSCVSAAFAGIYDAVSQTVEHLTEEKEEGDDKEWYDAGRTKRYMCVHALWNGPYHVPKLLIIMHVVPGVGLTAAIYRTLLADLLFSPIESVGVLSFTQIAKDDYTTDNVATKLYSHLLPYQLVKWTAHVPAHFLTFMSTTDAFSAYVVSLLYKSGAEVFLSYITARDVRRVKEELTQPTT